MVLHHVNSAHNGHQPGPPGGTGASCDLMQTRGQLLDPRVLTGHVNWSPTCQAEELCTMTLFLSQATMSAITWTLLAAPIHYAGLISDTDSFTMGCVTMGKLPKL